jgi:hypothetical protein
MQWLSEGDANSKFFPNIMSSRNRRNAIPFFLVDGVLVEGVDNVRSTVYTHFSSHFQSRRDRRPSMEVMHFRSLSNRERADLTKPFSVDEVKAAVWDCDNFKSPGPDDITFRFIKDFWDILKIDVMRVLLEFHRNGKLAKGINNTFIALIPKVDNPQRLNDFRPISLVGCIKFWRRFLLIGSDWSLTLSFLIQSRPLLKAVRFLMGFWCK